MNNLKIFFSLFLLTSISLHAMESLPSSFSPETSQEESQGPLSRKDRRALKKHQASRSTSLASRSTSLASRSTSLDGKQSEQTAVGPIAAVIALQEKTSVAPESSISDAGLPTTTPAEQQESTVTHLADNTQENKNISHSAPINQYQPGWGALITYYATAGLVNWYSQPEPTTETLPTQEISEKEIQSSAE